MAPKYPKNLTLANAIKHLMLETGTDFVHKESDLLLRAYDISKGGSRPKTNLKEEKVKACMATMKASLKKTFAEETKQLTLNSRLTGYRLAQPSPDTYLKSAYLTEGREIYLVSLGRVGIKDGSPIWRNVVTTLEIISVHLKSEAIKVKITDRPTPEYITELLAEGDTTYIHLADRGVPGFAYDGRPCQLFIEKDAALVYANLWGSTVPKFVHD